MSALNRGLMAAIALVATAACNTPSKTETVFYTTMAEPLEEALAAEDLGIVCEDTYIMGSRVPRNVCTTAVERLIAEETGRKFIERAQRGGF